MVCNNVTGVDHQKGDNSVTDSVGRHLHVIVLNGPINHSVETLLSAISTLSYSSCVNSSSYSQNISTLCCPTGEMLTLTARIKLIIETTDLQDASPSIIASIPTLTVASSHYSIVSEQSSQESGKLCVQRVLTAWTRTLWHWLGDFTPWLSSVEEICKVLSNNSIHNIIYTYTWLFRNFDHVRYCCTHSLWKTFCMMILCLLTYLLWLFSANCRASCGFLKSYYFNVMRWPLLLRLSLKLMTLIICQAIRMG